MSERLRGVVFNTIKSVILLLVILGVSYGLVAVAYYNWDFYSSSYSEIEIFGGSLSLDSFVFYFLPLTIFVVDMLILWFARKYWFGETAALMTLLLLIGVVGVFLMLSL